MARKVVKKIVNAKQRLAKNTKYPITTSEHLPATQGMLNLHQKQFKADIKSLKKSMEGRFDQVDSRFSEINGQFSDVNSRFSEIDSRFNQVEARFSRIDSRFDQVEARFSKMDSRFNYMEAQLSNVLSEVHRIAILMEEQNSRNKYVLDGYDQIYKRQDRLEVNVDARLQAIEDLISSKR
jgi:chromosome segregation ATPase